MASTRENACRRPSGAPPSRFRRASRLAAEAIRRQSGLPPASSQVPVVRDQTIRMRDGAVLKAGEPPGQATG